MFCPRCGFNLPDGSSFCPQCGNQLSGAPSAPVRVKKPSTFSVLKTPARRYITFALAALGMYFSSWYYGGSAISCLTGLGDYFTGLFTVAKVFAIIAIVLLGFLTIETFVNIDKFIGNCLLSKITALSYYGVLFFGLLFGLIACCLTDGICPFVGWYISLLVVAVGILNEFLPKVLGSLFEKK